MWKVICNYRANPDRNWESDCLPLGDKNSEERRCKRELKQNGGGTCRIRVCTSNNSKLIQIKNEEISIEKLGELIGLHFEDNSYYNRKYRIDKINSSNLGIKIEPIKASGKIIKFIIRSI
ncbi:MAG: hypothetical protein IPN79_12900 [Saprospiraceae bacterium]|nr:hypothetical protein [Saprospiraceae bacterium]